MIIERFYHDALAQASYLVGCAERGEALVVDANRDVELYIDAARAKGVRITHVSETHIHADFVSGTRELAARTGAQVYLSAGGDVGSAYGFAEADGAVLLKGGDAFQVGNVTIEVVHTPGHTPEHLTFLVTDRARADYPMAAITGDFVFVGDVGRPDLLETAAGVEGAADGAARALFRSLQEFKLQPDHLLLWPGHGAGSACGKGMSSVPHSTVGYERLSNWAFSVADEDEFVQSVLAGQPEPPSYFAEMKRVNRDGPPVLGGFPTPNRLPREQLPVILAGGALVIDIRPAEAYAAGHVPGTVNIPLNASFTTWAGWLVPYGVDFYLIADPARVDEAARELTMIGLDRIAGYCCADAVDAWAADGRDLGTVPQIAAPDLVQRLRAGEVAVLDVRGRAEWEAGHLPGVPNIPVGHLTRRLEEIPRDKPLVVHCQGGARSAIAASVLRASGIPGVINLAGGYADWSAGGNPTEAEGEKPGAGK